MIFDAASKDHYGLEDVKERILEHIAVSFLKAREGKRESELDQHIVRHLDSPFGCVGRQQPARRIFDSMLGYLSIIGFSKHCFAACVSKFFER